MYCKKCNQDKLESEFYNRGGSRKGRQNMCRECSARIAREYRQAQRDKVAQYKMAKGCELCSFKAVIPAQLDLDHVDPSTKTYKGSHKSYDAGWSWERIEAELAKCQVVCKNCHALRTHEEGHWKNPTTDIQMRQSSAQ